jgi:hypothetical protein
MRLIRRLRLSLITNGTLPYKSDNYGCDFDNSETTIALKRHIRCMVRS